MCEKKNEFKVSQKIKIHVGSKQWLSVHEADTLPTELMRFFISAKLGLNRRPYELQSDALPPELLAEPIEHEYKNMIYLITKKFQKLWNEERWVVHAQS